jgi:hypothetical protein
MQLPELTLVVAHGRAALERTRRQMEQDNKAHEDFSDLALKVFNLSQNAAETWLGSCSSARRELLEIIPVRRYGKTARI